MASEKEFVYRMIVRKYSENDPPDEEHIFSRDFNLGYGEEGQRPRLEYFADIVAGIEEIVYDIFESKNDFDKGKLEVAFIIRNRGGEE